MDDHLRELGAQRILPMGEGDELSGQDESFRGWAKDVFKVTVLNSVNTNTQGGVLHGTPGPVFWTLLFGLFFFVTVTIYLERLRPIKLIKQNKTKQTHMDASAQENKSHPTDKTQRAACFETKEFCLVGKYF